MVDTSKPELANPFFTVAQLFAFKQPPPADALKEVSVGNNNKAKYLEGEYIRLALNHLIGPGQWEFAAHLEKTETSDYEKDIFQGRGQDRKKVGTETWISVCAVVRGTLKIHARDGTERCLTFEGNAVGDALAAPRKGISDALDKAIKSAETDTLKRCVSNLGRVFGLDINGKVKVMPRGLKDIQADLDRRRAEAAPGSTAQLPTAAQVIDITPRASAEPVAQADSAPAAEPQTSSAPTEVEAPKPARSNPDTAVAETPKEPAAPIEKPAPASAEQSPPATPQTETAQTKAAANDQPVASSTTEPTDWDLSIAPQRYEDWIKCAKTMATRLTKMASEQELNNFLRRNKRLIDTLPVIAAKDGQPEKNFQVRWRNAIQAFCAQNGYAVPEGYALDQAA